MPQRSYPERRKGVQRVLQNTRKRENEHMAQPASASFPSSDNSILLVRELKNHLQTLSLHLLNALENDQLALQEIFLRDFAQNVTACNKLLASIPFNEMSPDLRLTLEEISEALAHILNMTIETPNGGPQMTLLDSIKNFTLPSTQESDLSIFLTSLEKYPESFRILTQELDLLAQDLNRYL
jgi:hypothetical protein